MRVRMGTPGVEGGAPGGWRRDREQGERRGGSQPMRGRMGKGGRGRGEGLWDEQGKGSRGSGGAVTSRGSGGAVTSRGLRPGKWKGWKRKV